MNSTELTTVNSFITEPIEVDYWDPENPRSIYSLIADFMDGELLNILLDNRLLLNYLTSISEDELKVLAKPSHDINHLRLRFWKEYALSQDTECPMNFRRVFDGLVSKEAFLNVFRNPSYLAWILKPPKDYVEDLEEMLNYSLGHIREILDSSIKNEDGSTNSAVMNAKLKAFSMLENRLKGLPTQTIMKRSLSVNINKSDKNKKIPSLELTEEEIAQQELMNLRQDIARLEYDPRVKQDLIEASQGPHKHRVPDVVV